MERSRPEAPESPDSAIVLCRPNRRKDRLAVASGYKQPGEMVSGVGGWRSRLPRDRQPSPPRVRAGLAHLLLGGNWCNVLR